MATTLAFKDIIDLPEWRPLSNSPVTFSTAGSFAYDLRNNEDRHPVLYFLASLTSFSAYFVKNDEWVTLASPALTGTFGAGSTSIMAPSRGPRGTLTTGSTTTAVNLSTALPSAVGVNQLANRGDGRGFKIRIVGSSAGGSGKTEERLIIANTGGTTPTINVDSAFSFTPASGDTYEILAGRVYLLSASTLAAGQWKYYDIATNSFSGNLATTNLPATINTDSSMVHLCESYVPYTRSPGEGFVIGAGTYNGGLLGCLTATAISATTITGQSSSGDAAVLANEYRNFQIRIVEDTGTPTAVGQRRNITSHTAGASAVYTVATWTVNPSATAKFVIENNDDRILLTSSASANTYTYIISADTWDTTTFAARGTATNVGCTMEQSFGIVPDTAKNARHSFIYSFRGNATNVLDVLDIAGATAGSWTNGAVYGNQNTTFTSGTTASYDPVTMNGRYLYINQAGTQRNYRFDMQNRVLETWAFLRYTQSTASVGQKTAYIAFIDGATKLGFWFLGRSNGTEFWHIALQR